jgi:hypothetical protein
MDGTPACGRISRPATGLRSVASGLRPSALSLHPFAVKGEAIALERPRRKSEKRRRVLGVRVRVTADELTSIAAAADRAGVSVAQYLRDLGLDPDRERVVVSRRLVVPPEVRAELGHLRRVGGLLARSLMQTTHAPDLDDEIRRTIAQIRTIEKSIMSLSVA